MEHFGNRKDTHPKSNHIHAYTHSMCGNDLKSEGELIDGRVFAVWQSECGEARLRIVVLKTVNRLISD